MGRVRLLEADVLPQGEEAWAQLSLAQPVAVAKGDLFVIRSPNETLGGGEIVETHPRRHRRREEAVLERLQVLEQGSASDVVLQIVSNRLGALVSEIVERSGLTTAEVRGILRAGRGGPGEPARRALPRGERLRCPRRSAAGRAAGFPRAIPAPGGSAARGSESPPELAIARGGGFYGFHSAFEV